LPNPRKPSAEKGVNKEEKRGGEGGERKLVWGWRSERDEKEKRNKINMMGSLSLLHKTRVGREEEERIKTNHPPDKPIFLLFFLYLFIILFIFRICYF